MTTLDAVNSCYGPFVGSAPTRELESRRDVDFDAGWIRLDPGETNALSVRREGGAREPLSSAFKNLKPFVDKHLGGVHEPLPGRRT